MSLSWDISAFGHLLLSKDMNIRSVSESCEPILNISVSLIEGRSLFDIIQFDAVVARAIEEAVRDNNPLFVTDCDMRLGFDKSLVVRLAIKPHETFSVLSLAPCDLAARGREYDDRALSSTIGMAQMLAHEVKNPLAGIAGAAQLLAQDLVRSEDRELTDLIVAETRRVTRMLSQVEQFGDLREPDIAAHNVHDTLRQVVQSARLGYAKSVQIMEEYDPSLPKVKFDPDHLLQIVLNLVKNAAEAVGGTAGIIRVRSSYDSGYRRWGQNGGAVALPVQVEIIDTGRGIPEALRNSLFEPFVSGRENGTGLGLALVQKLIQQNGASISVQSAERYTCFRLSLPIAPKSQQED